MLYASSTTPLSFICKFWNGPETKGIFYSLLVFYRSLLFNFNWLFAFHLWAQTILWMTDSCGCQLAFSILIFKMSYSISFMKPSKLFVFTWSYSTVLTCSRHEMFVPGTEISLIWKKEIEILGVVCIETLCSTCCHCICLLTKSAWSTVSETKPLVKAMQLGS